MPFEASDKYTDSALRVGDTDTYPQRLVGEFIGTVVSNEWVNDEYIHLILKNNHAYTVLAAPIAALLFFYVLALGVLIGAEFNAAIEQFRPARVKPPRVLDERNWRRLAQPEQPPPAPGAGQPDMPS